MERARYGRAAATKTAAANAAARGLWRDLETMDSKCSGSRGLPGRLCRRAVALKRLDADWQRAVGAGLARMGRTAASVGGGGRRLRHGQVSRRRLFDARRAAHDRAADGWGLPRSPARMAGLCRIRQDR